MIKGKLGVCCAEACDEVVFESAYCSFGCVATVCAREYKLKFGVLLMEVVFECLAAFTVECVKEGFASMAYQFVMDSFVGFEKCRISLVGDGTDVDGVAVVVV